MAGTFIHKYSVFEGILFFTKSCGDILYIKKSVWNPSPPNSLAENKYFFKYQVSGKMQILLKLKQDLSTQGSGKIEESLP